MTFRDSKLSLRAVLGCGATLLGILISATAAAHNVAADDAQFIERIQGTHILPFNISAQSTW